jgi:hypothetical protein
LSGTTERCLIQVGLNLTSKQTRLERLARDSRSRLVRKGVTYAHKIAMATGGNVIFLCYQTSWLGCMSMASFFSILYYLWLSTDAGATTLTNKDTNKDT